MVSEYVHTVSAIAGLLPLRVRGSAALSCKRDGCELIADPRHGLPDARDLPALLLCVDAAVRGRSRVTARPPVSVASLQRIAWMRLQVDAGDALHLLCVANGWAPASSAALLSPEWQAWIRKARCGTDLPWPAIRRLSPGALALAVALATEERQSLALAKIAARCGSRTAQRRSMNQLLRKWLSELNEAGLDEWAIDRDQAVVFRKARLDSIDAPWWARK